MTELNSIIPYEMKSVTRVQILDEVAYVSHCANALEKCRNPSVLSPVMGKIVGQTRIFNLGSTSSLGKENSKFKPALLRFKDDIVSHPDRSEVVGYILIKYQGLYFFAGGGLSLNYELQTDTHTHT